MRQYGFQVTPGRLYPRTVPLGSFSRVIELLGHAVKGLHQDTQFVFTVRRQHRAVVATGNGFGALGQDG